MLANCERLFSGTLNPPAALASDTDRIITHDTMQMGEDFMEAQECPKVWLQRGAVQLHETDVELLSCNESTYAEV